MHERSCAGDEGQEETTDVVTKAIACNRTSISQATESMISFYQLSTASGPAKKRRIYNVRYRIKNKRWAKTYNSGDSLVVTHLTTNPPVHCLYMAERTGSLIFSVLWSYVECRTNF